MLKKVRARRFAENLVNTFKYKKPPIAVDRIAEQLPSKDLDTLKGLNIITVKREPFPSDLSDVSAILLKEKGRAVIAVNADHSVLRQRFSIAHEIGHLLLHSNDEHLTVDRYEKQFFTRADGKSDLKEVEANVFAAALLMPESMIRKDFEKYYRDDPDQVISNLANTYEVSQSALTYRLKNLGLL